MFTPRVRARKLGSVAALKIAGWSSIAWTSSQRGHEPHPERRNPGGPAPPPAGGRAPDPESRSSALAVIVSANFTGNPRLSGSSWEAAPLVPKTGEAAGGLPPRRCLAEYASGNSAVRASRRSFPNRVHEHRETSRAAAIRTLASPEGSRRFDLPQTGRAPSCRVAGRRPGRGRPDAPADPRRRNDPPSTGLQGSHLPPGTPGHPWSPRHAGPGRSRPGHAREPGLRRAATGPR